MTKYSITKPYIKSNSYGTYYYKDEDCTIYHREDGPAIEYADGDKSWYLNGFLNRSDGPAVDFKESKRWCKNNKLHRIDGPAIENSNGIKLWFLNGEEYSEEEHKRLVKMINFL